MKLRRYAAFALLLYSVSGCGGNSEPNFVAGDTGKGARRRLGELARIPVAFRAGRVAGALSLSPEDFLTRYAELEPALKSQTLITYCSGPRCPKAQKLERLRRRVIRTSW